MTEQDVVTDLPENMRWRYTKPNRTNSKMFLLNMGNCATTGYWQGEVGQYFKAWCPMPKRDKELEKKLFGDRYV